MRYHDPLGQIHSLASSEHCFRLKFVFILLYFEKRWRTDGQTYAKTMINTGLDYGLAGWINCDVVSSIIFVCLTLPICQITTGGKT